MRRSASAPFRPARHRTSCARPADRLFAPHEATQQRNNATTQQRNNATTQQRNNATKAILDSQCHDKKRADTRSDRQANARLSADLRSIGRSAVQVYGPITLSRATLRRTSAHAADRVECRRHGEAGQSALAEPVRSLIRPLSIGRAVASGGTALTLGFGVASAVAGVATAADGMRLPQGADSRSPTRRWPVGCVLHRVPAPICSW